MDKLFEMEMTISKHILGAREEYNSCLATVKP
jgi:hypothetical protein